MSQALSKAQSAAVGAVISIGGVTGASGTETFTPLGNITSAKFSGIKVGTSDVSTFAQFAKRKMAQLPDFGDLSVTTLRVSNDAGQAAVIAAAASGSPYDFKVQLEPNTEAGQTTTGDLIAFSGIVTEAGGFDMDLNKQSDYSFTIAIDGAWTVTEGS